MTEYNYQLWRLPAITKKFLSGTRLVFPGAIQQIEVMLGNLLLRLKNHPRNMFKVTITEESRNAIIPTTVKMLLLEQIKTWK